jgi:CysZ protein
MPSNPLSGAAYLLEGVHLIARPGLRRFVMVPLLVNVLVFALGIAAGVAWFEGFVSAMQARVPGWLQWLDWVLWPLFVLLLLAVVFYGFSLVANLIAAPFNSLLAEKVELMLTGRPIEQGFDLKRLLKESIPTLIDELRKILYAVVLGIPFLFLLFIPLVGPVLWFLYTAWILTLQYTDYPMGNHGIALAEMRKRLRTRRLVSLGFGASTAGMSLVPILNFIVMPAAVAGATALWLRELNGPNRYQGDYQSRVATRYLALVIDHLSGRISGEVLEGPHRGRPLEEVSTEELLDLLARANRDDVASAEAIEVYLDRERQRPVQRPAPARASATGLGHNQPTPRPAPSPMTPPEARAVLGLGPDAAAEDIRAAHKRLMQRLHPDRGGSDYLASKINEAKEVLLG